ncbi:MAG: sugar ABC transporter substrate-binding protein [Anaerolineales bacterium]
MKKKITFSVTLVLLFSVILGACSQPTPATNNPADSGEANQAGDAPTSSEPVEITYYTFSAFPSNPNDPNHQKELEQMVQLFEDSHPNIKVNIIKGDWANYFTKLKTMIMGGVAPDVIEMNPEYFVEYADKGVLLDLNTLMSQDTNFDGNIFYPASLQAFQRNGMQLGIPETFSTVVLVYNKDLFDQAGVAYPTEEWTWQDVIQAGQKLTDPEKGIFGLYSGLTYWEFYKKAAQNNCEFFNADQTEVTINSPQCVDALQAMVDMVNKYHIMANEAEMGGQEDGALFMDGKLAMDLTGIWMFSEYSKAPFNWDIAVEPGMAKHATHFFTNAVTVFAASQHPQEAWEWVKFFTSSEEMSKIRLASNWELPAVNKPEYVQEYLDITPPASRQVVYDSLKYVVMAPVIAHQEEMISIIGQSIDQVVLERLTAQEALDQTKTQIEELLQ